MADRKLIAKTCPGKPTQLPDHNAAGQMIRRRRPYGTALVYTHDLRGNLVSMPWDGDRTQPFCLWSETLRYDDRDRRTASIHQDGTADLFAYDPAGQVTAAAYGQASRDIPPLRLPNETEKTKNAQEQTKTQEPGTKNTFQPSQTFSYDPAGNRTRTTDNDQTTDYQANENNQYTALHSNGTPYQPEYDKLGNLLHDSTRKYTWDADIHLMSVTVKADEPRTKNEEQTTSCRYDALHRRVARIEPKPTAENGTQLKEQTLTYFVMDGWNVIAEYAAPQYRKSEIANHQSPAVRHVWSEDLSRTFQGAGGIGGLLSSTHFPSTLNYPLSCSATIPTATSSSSPTPNASPPPSTSTMPSAKPSPPPAPVRI